MVKRYKYFTYTASALVVIAFVLCGYWFFYSRFYQDTDDAYIEGNITTISARVSGYITQRLVKDNTLVKPGQPLALLDSHTFETQVNQAQATLAEQQAKLSEYIAMQVLNRNKIIQAKAKMEQAKALFNNALIEYRRAEKLVKHHYLSKASLDSAKEKLQSDQASVKASQAALNSSKSQISLTKTQIKQAQAAIHAAQASLQQAKLNLSYTSIRAPEEGIITNRSLQKGMYVSAGTPLFSLVPLNSVWITANFKETQLKKLKPGEPVTITVSAYPGKKLTGQVDSISPGSGSVFALLPTDNATGNFTKVVQRVPVKIRILNKDGLDNRLYPGLSTEVSVNTSG